PSKQVEMFIWCFLLLLAINSLSAGRVPQLEERIIGGSDIEIEQAPWQVSLQINGHHYCGGSIYSTDIIITAAHCRFADNGRRRLEARDFEIRAGSALWNYGGIRVNVASIISHDKYNYTPPYEYDIAVVRLSEPLELSNKVQTISLAETVPAFETPAFTSGWGGTSAEDLWINGFKDVYYKNPIHLQGIRTQINSFCYWSPLYCPDRLDVIYAGSSEGSSCRGDSGGPLIANGQLVGIVSLVHKYCDGIATYTSVPYFRNWILDAIKLI
ncbi:hypothetical protein KR084_000234, partial [Drosophila pseudotakahashii]